MIIQECSVDDMARVKRLWKERESRFEEACYKGEYEALKRRLGEAGIGIQENPDKLVFVTLAESETES